MNIQPFLWQNFIYEKYIYYLISYFSISCSNPEADLELQINESVMKNYEETIKLSNQLLEINPDNSMAQESIELAKQEILILELSNH